LHLFGAVGLKNVVEDVSGPISGFMTIPEMTSFRARKPYGELTVEIPGSMNERSCVIDASKGDGINGYICFSKNQEITGRIYIHQVGPTWSKPSTIRRLESNMVLLVFEELKMLRPQDDFLYYLYNIIPKRIRTKFARRIARFILTRMVTYRPTLFTDSFKFTDSFMKTSQSGAVKVETRKPGQINTDQDIWEEVSDGVFIDKTPKDIRFREICERLDEAEKELEAAGF